MNDTLAAAKNTNHQRLPTNDEVEALDLSSTIQLPQPFAITPHELQKFLLEVCVVVGEELEQCDAAMRQQKLLALAKSIAEIAKIFPLLITDDHVLTESNSLPQPLANPADEAINIFALAGFNNLGIDLTSIATDHGPHNPGKTRPQIEVHSGSLLPDLQKQIVGMASQLIRDPLDPKIQDEGIIIEQLDDILMERLLNKGAQVVTYSEDNRILAYAIFALENTDDKLSGSGEIIMIQVDPSAPRRGIATSLHSAMLAIGAASGITRWECEVECTNARGMGLWLKHGWHFKPGSLTKKNFPEGLETYFLPMEYDVAHFNARAIGERVDETQLHLSMAVMQRVVFSDYCTHPLDKLVRNLPAGGMAVVGTVPEWAASGLQEVAQKMKGVLFLDIPEDKSPVSANHYPDETEVLKKSSLSRYDNRIVATSGLDQVLRQIPAPLTDRDKSSLGSTAVALRHAAYHGEDVPLVIFELTPATVAKANDWLLSTGSVVLIERTDHPRSEKDTCSINQLVSAAEKVASWEAFHNYTPAKSTTTATQRTANFRILAIEAEPLAPNS
jgi:GNAT superfamily N-acetyltransferase